MPGEGSDARSRILIAAREELAAVGQAAFTMEGVARRAFYAIGTLYNYRVDRSDLLVDLATESIGPDIRRALSHTEGQAACIAWVLDEGRAELMLVGELLLGGHHCERLARVATDMWAAVLDGLRNRLPSSMAWYVATYGIGNAMLDVIGLPGPSPATGRVQWLTDACAVEQWDMSGLTGVSESGEFTVSADAEFSRDDPTTVALIEAARSLLSERGVHAASTRSIARMAGVTTGAVYRRYGAKSRLFADVLIAELSPERYAWTWDLIGAFASNDPYRTSAEVLTEQLVKQSRDSASQRVLLQLGIAARNDPELRDEVQRRVDVAHAARCAMFTHFAEVGLMRDDVDPAVFAWGFQAPPVGNRVLAPLGFELDRSTVAEAVSSILYAAAKRG